MVHPEVGDKVPHKHVGPSEAVAEVVQDAAGDEDTNIAHDDTASMLVVINRASGIEVVNTAEKTIALSLTPTLALALMEVVAGDVGEEVVGPAEELLSDEHDEGVDGGLLGELAELVGHLAEAGGLLLAGAGHEDHVALEVSGGLVVGRVGQLPRVVRDEESRVEEPARDVVDGPRGGEGLVTALVGEDPDAGAEEALEHGVQRPKTSAGGRRGDVLGGHIVVEDVKRRGEAEQVAGDVQVALEGGPLEAVGGDGVADILDGEVRGLEGVAVGVEEDAEVLALDDGFGGERGEGGGGGRGPGGVEG